MLYFYFYVAFLVVFCLAVASYVLFAWYRTHKRMWQLCFRVGLLARDGRSLLKQVLATSPLFLFFFGRLQLVLDSEVARLEQRYRIRPRRWRLTISPGEQLRDMTERVDRLEKTLAS
jgi:hypothetical protein